MEEMNTITALKIEPGMLPRLVEIGNDLDSLQKAVSIGAPYQGLIEILGVEDGVAFMMNEEGKLINLPPNRLFMDDCLCGVFYVIGISPGYGVTSIPQDKILKYTEMFGERSILYSFDCM